MAFPSTEVRSFPLSKVCLYADGTRAELTPPGTNIGVFISAVACAVFYLQTLRAGQARDSGTERDVQTDVEAYPARRN